MTPSSRSTLRRWCVALAALVAGAAVFQHSVGAYQFIYEASGGSQLPVAWRNLPVNFIVDVNPASVPTFQNTVTSAFTTWNNVATAQDIFGTTTVSGVDFTGANYQTAWGVMPAAGDANHEIVCDTDGTALAAVGSAGSLGRAMRQHRVVGGEAQIVDGLFILNCQTPQSADFNHLGTMVHELGHVIGLRHSSAYLADAERLEPQTIANAPTMYPYAIPGNDAASATLEADDMAGISHLYPAATFTTAYATITGTVTRCGTNEAVSGVNVRAVSTANVNAQITRYSGFDGNSTGFYEIKVPVGTYHLSIEVMSLSVGAMGMLTAVDKDFATEYKSVASDEDNCLEELPDTPLNIVAAAPDEPLGEGGGAPAGLANQNFRTNPVELAFVVDDTGSMGNEIGAVRTALTNEIARLQASGKPFPSTAIVTFKDNVTVRKISRDPAVLQPIVNALSASGGGDCPEFSNDALLAAGRLLRKGGKALLFTDADSHPSGSNSATVSSLYTSKSLRMSVLLSGACGGSLDAGGGLDASNMDPARSQNPGYIEPDAPADHLPAPAPLGDETSVETYSTIANATGGTFAALPGIKLGTTTETARYVNTGTNIAVSAANLPTVSLVSPNDGPRGTTIDLDVSGSNTNFQSSSLLSFGGTGITVNFRLVRSATSMTANVTIDPAATLGFRDVTVTTGLGGGATEVATGVGAFNIITAPSGATIVSVSPTSGGQGAALNVAITGINTAFNAASVVTFCQFTCFSQSDHDPKITVNSVTVTSPTTLVANISIAADAAIAYRNVGVFTGSQTANEFMTGPFLVTAPPLALPALTSVSPTFAVIGDTLTVAVTGVNTNFVNGASVLSFSGAGITVNSTTVTSPTSATASITISGGATPGFRDVFVTTGGEIAALLSGFNVLGGPPTAEAATNLAAASISGTSVTLRWTPPIGGLPPTGYVLEGGLNPGEVLASIPTGSPYPIFTFTAPSGVFYVRIHTLSGANKSVASNEIRIWVNNQSAPPSAPANLTGMRNGSSIALTWRNTFAGGAPAAVVLDVSGAFTTTIPLGLTDSFTYSGVPNGTYTLRLRAINAAGASAQSNSVQLTFPGACTGAPFPPTNFLGYKIGNTVFVVWDPPASGPAPADYILNVSGSFVDSFATPGRILSGTVAPGSYGVSVQARNACGTSAVTPGQTVVVP